MSAFFIAINRDGKPFDKSVADSMMSQLDRFGGDSHKLVVCDYFAIGFQTLWRVPEETGEQQPLKSGARWFGFYGRVDNREQLFESLSNFSSLNEREKRRISDAHLVEHYFLQYGVEGLANIVGPFVLFCFDQTSQNLVLARDGMGARTLSYKVDQDYILAASYEMALAAHPSVDYRLNDETISHHLVSQMQAGPSSIIAGLVVLHPGHSLEIAGDSLQADPDGPEQKRFYKPDPSLRVTFSSNEEYASEFRRLLTQAVERRMRCIANVGTQLSGGMDSMPTTILAAEYNLEKDQCLSAYSWVFDQYPEADERQYSSPLCQKYEIEQVMINCDEVWLSYDKSTPLDPLGPIYNPFMTYNHELFKQAQARSVTVMLNGIHGDILYGYTNGILYELLKAGEFRKALRESGALLRSCGSIKSFVKDVVLRPLNVVQRYLAWRRRRTGLRDDVLQPSIIEQIRVSEAHTNYLVDESRKALRPEQWRVVLGNFAGSDAAIGRFLESEYGIERRYPFRDRDLCEFMLAIPSEQLALNNVKRPIVKRAFKSDFSDDMSRRNAKAYFADVMMDGLRRDQQNQRWANSGSREWSYYVKECYFDAKVEQNNLRDVVKWRCGYYDYWKSVCYHPMAKQLGLSNEKSN